VAQPLNISMPFGLDVQAGYTLRVTAIDPTTGNLVGGVVVDTTVLTVDLAGDAVASDLQTGDWFLVPGPGA